MDTCLRCGSANIEKHRIIHGIDGGKYTKENILPLCKACHDYQHSKENILAALQRSKERSKGKGYPSEIKRWQERVTVLEARLRVLEERNTVENIRSYGYRTYWGK